MKLVKLVSEHTGINESKFYKTTLFRSDALLLGLNCLEPGQVLLDLRRAQPRLLDHRRGSTRKASEAPAPALQPRGQQVVDV